MRYLLANILKNINRLVKQNYSDTGNFQTKIPRLVVIQGDVPDTIATGLYEPMIYLVVQGHKALTIGDKVYQYFPSDYFVMSVDVPVTSQNFPAASGAPFTAVALTVDSSIVSDIVEQTICHQSDLQQAFGGGVSDARLLGAWSRLISLYDKPDDIGFLSTIYEKELLYYVLKGTHGTALRDIAVHGTALKRIHLAIGWIKGHFREDVGIAQLSDIAGMSHATFYRQFKKIIDLTPMQYLKQLRLLEARRILMNTNLAVGQVCFDVGYQSQAQFSRDYKQFFKRSPLNDIKTMRAQLKNSLE